jgi:hypothetical protein
MVQSVNNIAGLSNYPSVDFTKSQQQQVPLQNFDIEDKAIISSQAKILNELDKYNNGQSDELNLALTTMTSKHQIEASLSVIKTKNEILSQITKIGED